MCAQVKGLVQSCTPRSSATLQQLCGELLLSTNATTDSQDPTTLRVGCGLTTTAQLNVGLAALESKIDAAISGAPGGPQANATATGAAVTQLRDGLLALQGQLATTAAGTASLNATAAQQAALVSSEAALLEGAVQQQSANITAELAALTNSLQLLGTNTTAALAALRASLPAINVSEFVRVGATIDAASLGGVPADAFLRMPVQIVMYSVNGDATVGGNFGGRAGADSRCQLATARRPPGYLRVRAFLSIGADDAINNMPTNYGVPTNVPIVGPGASPATIASDWADLLKGPLDNFTLIAAGVMPAGTGLYWSGSDMFGGVALTCNGWTDKTNSFVGSAGQAYSTSTNWLGRNSASCSFPFSFACLAF